MDWLFELYRQQPFWVWLAVGAMLLTAEVATGSGWLLWAAGAAAAVAYVALLGVDLGLPGEIVLFAVLAGLSTFVGRRFIVGRHAKADVNDNVERLIGREGLTTSPFADGYGRVAVEGCEWAAELEGGGALPEGARIEVAAMADGARLLVRQAG